MAEKAYQRSGGYQALIELLPIMQKEKLYSAEEIDKLRKDAYKGLINQYMAEGGSENLKNWWQSQGRKIRHDLVLQSIIAACLIECDDSEAAEKIIITGLKQQYDQHLLLLVPRLQINDSKAMNKILINLIKQSGGATPLLNSTLGQLALQHGEWARSGKVF
ncbi:hypothetical protein ARSQ2_00321 [Arsenophonus endosymbiont of Bemisia tabaci Q2]|nr:hypothetical protein ARSQ2_00321 [Arsenophonus endosymbiont of Bemisia tabaci Q2]